MFQTPMGSKGRMKVGLGGVTGYIKALTLNPKTLNHKT